MKAEAKSLRFLGESPQKLTIPFFQRRYVWGESNWEELLNSLSDQKSKSFLGSIIIKTVNANNPTEAQVIDGQQRLTTLTILSKAIYDTLTIDSESLKGVDPYKDDKDDDKYGKSELKSFLFYKINAADSFTTAKVKIQHSRVDREAYESIIEQNFTVNELTTCKDWRSIDYDSEETSQILKCYIFFRSRLVKMNIEKIISLHNSMYNDEKKMIVLITMDLGDDNEQCIFDTINRAGVHLSVSDIIKNNLFKQCLDLCEGNHETIQQVIKKYELKWEQLFYIYPSGKIHIWDEERIFGNQRRTNLSFLLYCVAFAKWGKTDEIFSDLAGVYKEKTQDMDLTELFDLIDQIAEYAIVFRDRIIDLQKRYKSEENYIYFDYNDYIKRLLLILEVFGVQMFYPYVLKQLVENNHIFDEKLKSNFMILESYVVRRRLSGKGVSDYANKCDLIIKNGIDELLYEMNDKTSYISNNMIRPYLYNIKPENAKLVLFIVELYKRKSEKQDINSLTYKYTLEHIMPRSWQTYWLSVPLLKSDGTVYKTEDGTIIDITTDEGQKIRNIHIESLGNMTLLSQNLNSSIKNNTFEKKINGEGERKPGYKKYTSLFITKELVDNYDKGEIDWNEASIDKRAVELERIILSVWPSEF